MKLKKGLLVINLGTPASPKKRDVRIYLQEFLSDRRVIDLPAPLRYLLLYLIILPFRPKKTAALYQSIWTEQGSPLLVSCEKLTKKLQIKLNDYSVVLGMRYGNPSIQQALLQLSTCEQVTILPLYPQYSSAASGSSLEAVFDHLANQAVIPSLKIIRDFYNHPAFINALCKTIAPYIADNDHILFSYHGIPEPHLQKIGCQPVCQTQCPPITTKNAACYRAQCQETSRLVAAKLELSPARYSMAFQSRLGRVPWIKPYTDEILPQLIERGIKRLAVVCPSFTNDCLETIEEIGIRAKEQWLSLGGSELLLIPCLNDSDVWVNGLAEIINHTD